MKRCIPKIECITSEKSHLKQSELKQISNKLISLNFVFIFLQCLVLINEFYNSNLDEKLIPLAASIIILTGINLFLIKGLFGLTKICAMIASILC